MTLNISKIALTANQISETISKAKYNSEKSGHIKNAIDKGLCLL
jgi:hypothetical protein